MIKYPMTLIQTAIIFKKDIYRRLALEGKRQNIYHAGLILLNRGVISVLIYRIKRYLYLKNIKPLRGLIWLLRFPEFHYCHNEIDPRAEIAEGLVLNDYGGIALSYAIIIGKNCTFMGRATPTLGALEGIHSEDRISFGDYCIIGHNVRVINPIKIESGTQIKANSVVVSPIKQPGCIVSGFPSKTIAQASASEFTNWSPIICNYIDRE